MTQSNSCSLCGALPCDQVNGQEITEEMVKRGALAWVKGKDDENGSKAASRFYGPVRRMLEAALGNPQEATKHV